MLPSWTRCRVWRCLTLACVLSACSTSKSEPPAVRPPAIKAPQAERSIVVLEPPGKEPVHVEVELALTPRERAQGLMFRRELLPEHGMLFVFERAEQQSFWMKNTYLPLDMIFITSSMRVLGVIENAKPHSTESRQVPGESQYVLEVNAGFAQIHGIGTGTAVRFIGVPQAS